MSSFLKPAGWHGVRSGRFHVRRAERAWTRAVDAAADLAPDERMAVLIVATDALEAALLKITGEALAAGAWHDHIAAVTPTVDVEVEQYVPAPVAEAVERATAPAQLLEVPAAAPRAPTPYVVATPASDHRR